MEHRKQADNIERRAYAEGVEVRAKDGGGSVIRGYAARFGSAYPMWERNIGTFYEEVGRDAFRSADLTDVRVLFNHDPNQILGRTKSGTARVGVDENGLWYEADLPESAVSLREAVARGDIDQSSWGFSLSSDGGDTWEVRAGKKYRTLSRVAVVFDASPVTFPANPDTTVAKRSFDLAATGEQRASAAEEGSMLQYLIDNSAWALTRSNDMVGSLNYWIERYSAQDAQTFGRVTESCKAAKSAIIDLINAHTEVISILNNKENRSKNGDAREEQRKAADRLEADTLENIIKAALI